MAARPRGLSRRDTALRELMDDPDCDPGALAATYRRFDVVNRLVSAWGHVYRTRVAPELGALGRPARVLDLGCGGGDVVVRLAGLAARDGLDVEWVGADPDPRAITAARERARPGVRFVAQDSRELLAAGERFDLVVSNHVLHHLDADALRTFTDDSLALSTGTVLHADIARGRLAYGLYAVGITPLSAGTFLRVDGLRSIRRSYRAAELAAALGSPWRVETPAPFRLLAVARGRAHAGGASGRSGAATAGGASGRSGAVAGGAPGRADAATAGSASGRADAATAGGSSGRAGDVATGGASLRADAATAGGAPGRAGAVAAPSQGQRRDRGEATTRRADAAVSPRESRRAADGAGRGA
nr:methyltransferase domain-containing protein [Microbacterium sp. SORGH_AS_1204]